VKCSCGGIIRITNTYPAGPGARTQGGRCSACMKRSTIVMFLAVEAPTSGDGAAATARRLVAGDLFPVLMPKAPALTEVAHDPPV
jgi:hypothetical protein